MSFKDWMVSECTASIVCSRCGRIESKEAESLDTARILLDGELRQAGWKMFDDQPYCPECAK